MHSICSKGNDWASNYYEANIASSFQRPCKSFTSDNFYPLLANDNQKMERFIRDKYERKKYCATQPPALRDASILGVGGAAPQQVFL